RRGVHDPVAGDPLLGTALAVERIHRLFGSRREHAELPAAAGPRHRAVAHAGHAIPGDVDAGDERVRADLVLWGGGTDPIGEALRDEARAPRRVEELDDERRVAML